MAISKRIAFLKRLENKPTPMCKKSAKKHIDSYLTREYNRIIDNICWNFHTLKDGGLSAFDLLNDAIIRVYFDKTLSFSNQWECDIYMQKELNSNKFIIKLKK